MSMDIYQKIYDVSGRHMVENDKRFNFSFHTLEFILYKDPYRIDMTEFEHISNQEFLFPIYLRLLGRFPYSAERALYAKKESGTELAKQECILNMIDGVEYNSKKKRYSKCLIHYKEWDRQNREAYGNAWRFHKFKGKCKGVVLNYIVFPVYRALPQTFRRRLVNKVLIGSGN